MKVLSRLNIKTKAAVKDIPADLKKIVEQDYPDGMKRFISTIYRYTNKDLNELQMAPDTFTKTTRLREKDILNVIGNDDKVLVLSLDYKKDQKHLGMILITPQSTSFARDHKLDYVGAYSPSKNKTINIMGQPKNVIWLLNTGDFDYKAWIIDLSKAEFTMDKMEARRKAQEGIIKRYQDAWGVDKSGYKIDRSKYVDMLKKLKQEGNVFIDRISRVSKEIFDLISEINKSGLMSYFSYDISELVGDLPKVLNASIFDSSKEVNEKIDKLSIRVNAIRMKFEKKKAEK